MKRFALSLAFVALAGAAMAQWKSAEDKAYLDSVARCGEEKALVYDKGWWLFPPELTRQGGEAIRRQNRLLEACANGNGMGIYPRDWEKSFRIKHHAVRCILSRTFYNMIFFAQETEKGRYELFWTAFRTNLSFNHLHTREMTREEWEAFNALLDNSSIRAKGLGDTGCYNGADTWSVELYQKGKYYVKTYPFGGDLKDAVLYLYSLTDFKWPQSFLLNSYAQREKSCWREWWRESDESALNHRQKSWFDFELHTSFGEIPEIRVRLCDGKILWCREEGSLIHDAGCRTLTNKEWTDFLALKDSLDALNPPYNMEDKGAVSEYDGSTVRFQCGANGKALLKKEIMQGYEPMKLFHRALQLSGLHIHWWEERHLK